MLRNDFLLLSNTKHMGQQTCDLINGCRGVEIREKIRAAYPKCQESLGAYKSMLQRKEILLLENILPNIDHPPPFVYCMGQGRVHERRVAIIGARNATNYGHGLAYKLAYDFAQRGFTVVSGMARGVDASAHWGALDGGGSTVAVLGSGILRCYPKGNQALYDEIRRRGKLMSEYGFEGQAHKHHFPFRNRLISGLAQVVVVVEAKRKSGTMITVRCALDQGKTVYAVPGPVDSPLSQGTHQLIHEGAQIFLSVDDMVKDWPVMS